MDTGSGVYEREGTWYVVGPAQVERALHARALRVVRAGPAAGPAAWLSARMARFSDGPEHLSRRACVERLLPAPCGLTGPAAGLAESWYADVSGPVDAMPVARAVPVLVLAAVLGVPRACHADVAHAIADLAAALTARSPTCDDAAVEHLVPMLSRDDPEEAVAVVSILLQARDATAALVGGALLQPVEGASAQVEAALREAPPVTSTRRRAAEDVEIDGVLIPAGADVDVGLSSAESGGPAPATFGSGPHACPGAAQARALAEGVLIGLAAAGWRVVPGQAVAYELRPNLRLPALLLLEQS